MESLYNLSVMVSVLDKFTGPVKNMAKTFAGFEKQIQQGKAMVDFGQRMAVSGALVQGAADKSVRALKGLLTPTVANQRALGELASLGIKDFNALSLAAERFSSTWSGTTEDAFIAAAYDIKSGIASLTDEGVAQFTAMAALTAKATKATTADMTSLYATGYGIYKDLYSSLSDVQFGEMFSAGIAASVQQFKTTGTGMAEAISNLGAAAASAQRPFEEQLAILGMLQATMPGGEAGTKYRAFVQTAAKAGQSLGLSFVDSSGQLLGMVDILEKLRGKYGETLSAMEKQQIQKAFGTEEAVALVDLLYTKVGALEGNIGNLNVAMSQGTAFTEGMARTMNDDLGASLGLLGQNWTILKRAIGDELAPLIKDIVPEVRAWVSGFRAFAQAHPTLVRTGLLLATIATAALLILAPILTVGSGLIMMGGHVMWSFGQIKKGFTTLGPILKNFWSTGMTGFLRLRPVILRAGSAIVTFGRNAIFAATRALPGLIGSVWSFTAALLANPVTWVVIGVVALGAALVLLARNWDKVTAFFSEKWGALKARFAGSKDWLLALFPLGGLILMIKNRFPQLYEAGRALILTFARGIKSLITRPVELVREGLAKIRKLLPFSDAKEGPLSTLTRSGRAFISTFAGGIQSRLPYLQAVAAATLATLTPPQVEPAFSSAISGGGTPGVNFRQFIRETRESSTHTRDRRPIVVVVPGASRPEGNFDQYIDLALRQLEMRGD